MRNYYCSQKFWWLTVDIEKRVKYSCCAAEPVRLNFDQLISNTDNLFNCNTLQTERQLMLNNQRVSSCETACWKPHDLGQQARIDTSQSWHRTHTDPIASPEYLNIVFGSDCNLTCVYCNKNYSTAWRRDLMQNGTYTVDAQYQPRFEINLQDRVLSKLSQNDIMSADKIKVLFDSIQHTAGSIKKVYISGGEPLLSNHLLNLIELFDRGTEIIINTGLGVETTRLKKMLDRLKAVDNLAFEISAETIEKHYEFTRYGNNWNKFLTNVDQLQDFDCRFRSTLTNLTVINFSKFRQRFDKYRFELQFCHDPEYLSVHVLDKNTKKLISEQLQEYPDIVNNLNIEPDDSLRKNCKVFLEQFAKRRDLGLNIFPESFLQWLNQ